MRRCPEAWAERLPAIRWPAPPLWPRSTSSRKKTCSSEPARRASPYVRPWSASQSAIPGRVADVRGLGAMLAIEFNDDRHPSGKSVAQRVSGAAFDEGLIVLTAGPKACALRLLAPLTATADDIARGSEALERACARVLS